VCAPIREILKVTEQPGIISFAGGLPAPELFPVAEILYATSVFWARTALPIRCKTAPPKGSHRCGKPSRRSRGEGNRVLSGGHYQH
jgi:hypothetical protein